MSHYVIAVLTKHGTNDEVAQLMAPYHQFECTGLDDQYVVDVDITGKLLAEYEEKCAKAREEGEPLDQTLAEWVVYWYGMEDRVVTAGPDGLPS